MKRFYLAILITAFMLAAMLSVLAADNEDLEFVLQGIKYNDSLVKNCGVKFSYAVDVTAYPEGRNAFSDLLSKNPEAYLPSILEDIEKERVEYDIVLKGEKERIEEKQYIYGLKDDKNTPILFQHRLWTYDGEKTQQIFYPAAEGAKSQVVVSNGLIFSSYSSYPVTLTFENFLTLYPDMKLVDKTQLDGHECYLLEGTGKDKISKVKIWIAPEFGFKPIRSESSTPAFEIIKKTDYENYNGIWAVKRELFQSFFKKSESEKLRLSERELTVKKIEFICAPEEIPDSVFTLEFPPDIEQIWDTDKEAFIEIMSPENEVDTSVK